MTEHARTGHPHESGGEDSIAVQLPREEVEALLLAGDALQPILDRLRAQIVRLPRRRLRQRARWRPGTTTRCSA